MLCQKTQRHKRSLANPMVITNVFVPTKLFGFWVFTLSRQKTQFFFSFQGLGTEYLAVLQPLIKQFVLRKIIELNEAVITSWAKHCKQTIDQTTYQTTQQPAYSASPDFFLDLLDFIKSGNRHFPLLLISKSLLGQSFTTEKSNK